MIHCHEIKNAIKTLDKGLETFITRIDQISEDIKELEKLLTNKNIPVEVSIGVSRWLPLTQAEQAIIESSDYKGQKIVPQEWVGWGKCLKSNKWRLLHQRVLTVNAKPISSKPGLLQKIKAKPLIEGTVEERMRAHSKLPRLVKAIAKVINNQHVDLFEK